MLLNEVAEFALHSFGPIWGTMPKEIATSQGSALKRYALHIVLTAIFLIIAGRAYGEDPTARVPKKLLECDVRDFATSAPSRERSVPRIAARWIRARPQTRRTVF